MFEIGISADAIQTECDRLARLSDEEVGHAARGPQGAATASGNRGAATASGINGKARGSLGSALFLVRRRENWGANDHGDITHAWAGIVGRDGIEPGVFYTLGEDGKPVAVEP